jgi:beta-glucosidase/6-phospho-beta-glucosidase/beta-galactosidase
VRTSKSIKIILIKLGIKIYYERAFGYNKRFGLVHVDYDTQIQTPNDSYLAWTAGLSNKRLVKRLFTGRNLP